MSTPTLATLGAGRVDIDKIDRELQRLWLDAREHEDDAITRAVMSNVVIFGRDGRHADAVAQETAFLIQHHPSRVLLLTAGVELANPDDSIEAHVSAQCHLGGGDRQICSEHIRVSQREHDGKRLPSIARSLLLGDLPTALWWLPSEPPEDGAAPFPQLARMADRVIYDSAGWSVDNLATTAERIASTARAGVADLAWRRLKPWRGLIAQSLAPTLEPRALSGLRRITIQHQPARRTAAWLLLGWLTSRLAGSVQVASARPASGSWRLDIDRREVEAQIDLADDTPHSLSCTFEWKGGGLAVRRIDDDRLGAYPLGTDVPLRTLAARRPERALLVAGEMRYLGDDPLYAEALLGCGALAGS